MFCFDVFLLAKQAHEISAYYFFSFSRSAHASHSAQSHKLLLFHLESFLNSTKNTISGSKIKRNPRFLMCVCFFLSKNASVWTSEYVDKPLHFALTILRPKARSFMFLSKYWRTKGQTSILLSTNHRTGQQTPADYSKL